MVFDDVLEIRNGRNQKAVENPDGKYPIYGSGGIIGRADDYICDAETVVIGRKGNINKPIFVEEPFWNVDTAFGLEANKTVLLPRYLYYFCVNYDFEKHNKTVTIPSLTKADLLKIQINLPSLVEQKDIVDKLQLAEKIIYRRRQELDTFDRLIKARFVELFGDPINNPMNWDTDSVEALCDNIYGGGTPSKSHPEYYENGNIPWVSSKDMKTDIICDSQIHINQLGVDNSTAQMVPVNSMIMVIRSGILKHTLPVAVNAVPVTVNQDLKVFIPSERLLTKFMAVQFKILEKDILSGVRAVTADNIEFNSLKRRKLIVPPIEKQRRYVDFISHVNKSKSVVQKSLDETQVLFDSLMQKYFG